MNPGENDWHYQDGYGRVPDGYYVVPNVNRVTGKGGKSWLIEWVAELGSLHKQHLGLACEMVRQAALAGAGLVKIQLGHDPADPVRSVSAGLAFGLRDYCKYLGVELFASIFSNEGLALAQDLGLKRYKIAAGKAGDRQLVERVLTDAKPVYISAGRDVIEAAWGGRVDYAYPIFCVPKYPTWPWEQALPAKFGKEWWGYSDHLHGIGGCLLAAARGARYIEAHFTLDKMDLWTKDSAFAKTPGEFEQMVKLGNEMGQLAGELGVPQ